MHTTTRNKIEHLQNYTKKNLSRWYKKYGENVTGIRVDKKRKGRKVMKYYSIVFNVVKKIDEDNLSKKHIIPKHIEVPLGKRKTIKIRTDVRQTGHFNFHSGIMDPISDLPNGNQGTLGLMLKDRRENIFALTNYHVAAESLLHNQIFLYDVTRGDPRHDVQVGGNVCRLHVGKFSTEIDAAYVFIGSNLSVNNVLPDGRRVNNQVFIDGPLPPTVRNKIVSLYLPSRGGRINKPIEDNQAPLNTRIIRFIELVTVAKCSRGGDSGSLVMGDNNMVLGIVLGADDDFTYIVPFYKIHDFFPLLIV